MSPERVISFRPRTVLAVLGIVIAVALLVQVILLAQGVLTWIFVALFLTLAINPAVEWLRRRGVRHRGLAVGIVFLSVLGAIAAIGATVIPTVVEQVNDFARALPGYVQDITAGEGRLGFLETRYNVVERVREAVQDGGATRILGLSDAALSVTKSVITAIVAILTISFMTLFMLLEGPAWVERAYGLMPEGSQERWRRVGGDIYRTVGGYVTGNLLISLIAGVVTTIVLTIVGVPFAVALGLIVALLDLIPLAGATLAAIIVTTVAFLDTTTAGIVVLIFFVIYQQLENHVLQPLVYGRTVQLSPLTVLISVLIGAELAGVLGALAAIPTAGSLQVLLIDYLRHRRLRLLERPGSIERVPASGERPGSIEPVR
ncbi:MAG: AI-2E family transporter [Actinobacteria bacterium]|nr:AI-2E family transporter [Actinomycetota bacterium]